LGENEFAQGADIVMKESRAQDGTLGIQITEQTQRVISIQHAWE
jgi:hypothetical protein